MSKSYKGILEVDHERGVIYFHCSEKKVIQEMGSITLLRICRLKTPIPENNLIDVTVGVGVNFFKKEEE